VFHVDPNETTFIVSYFQEEDDTGGVIDDDDSENVEDLPDTGIGPASQGDAGMILYGLLSVAAVAGFAVTIRRRAA
jgi:hypothetical protein